MTFRLREHAVQAVLLDVEGTTTPIAFVYDVLFPFARVHLRSYLDGHADTEGGRDLQRTLRDEWRRDAASGAAPPDWRDDSPAAAAAYVEWLMDRDRKSPALKRLQGLIWEGGYRSGALEGLVFPDVRPAFERWRTVPVDIAIYSSGSVLAQRLLFGAASGGDLTPFIAGFFDTAVGAKTLADSYRRIAGALHHEAAQLLFVSDAPAELEAARAAGYQTLLAVRPGNRPVAANVVDRVTSFDELI